MKSISYQPLLVSILVLLGLTACSKDEEENSYEPYDLIKFWEAEECYKDSYSEGRIALDFQNDGRVYIIDYSTNIVFLHNCTYETYKNFITFHNLDGMGYYDGTYQITQENNSLSLSNDGISISNPEKQSLFSLKGKEDAHSFLDYSWKVGSWNILFKKNNTGSKYRFEGTKEIMHNFIYSYQPDTKQLIIDYTDDEPDEIYGYTAMMSDFHESGSTGIPEQHLLLFKQYDDEHYTCEAKWERLGKNF